MTELKPCPFCGGEAKPQRYFGNTYDDGFYVWCRSCEAQTTKLKPTIEQAIEAWNDRPNPWHTGIPIKKGWYVCKLKNSNLYETHYFTGSNWTEELFEKWRII